MAQDPWAEFRVGAPAPQQAPRPMPAQPRPDPIIKPADPYKASDEARKQAAEARAQQDQALQVEKFRLDQEKAALDAQKETKPTVDQAKIATLTTRLAGAFSDMAPIIQKDPSAAEPGVIESIRGGLSNDGVTAIPARAIAGANRRSVYDAEIDALDALLTLGTGAAYNREQLDGQRIAYFPAYGDTAEERALKKNRLARLIEAAKINAGPAWDNVAPAIQQFMQGMDSAPVNDVPAATGDTAGGVRRYRDEQGNIINEEDVVGSIDRVDGNDPKYMQLAAGVGDIVEAGGDLLGIVGNPLNATINALAGTNLSTDMGGTLRQLSGLPQGDQWISAINQGIAGGLLFGGTPAAMARYLPNATRNAMLQFGANPVGDAIVGGTAAGAGELAKESGAGPVGQFGATVLGGLAPAAIMGGARQISRIGGGGVPPGSGPVIKAGERLGVTIRRPDVDQAAAQQASALEKTERGNPIIRGAIAQDNEDMGGALSRVAGGARPASSPYEAGETIQTALSRHGTRTKDAASVRYQRAEKLSGDPAVPTTQAVQTTARLVAELQAGGANTNSAEIKFLMGLGEDLSRGDMTVSQLRNLRTEIRGRLKESGLDHNRAEARVMEIMDSVSKDIENGLSSNPRALEQYKLGDKIWRERMDFRKEITERLIGKNGDRSAIETAAAAETLVKKDPLRLKRLVDEMEPDERSEFAATIANSLGRNNKGEFSPAIFLSNIDQKKGSISPKSIRMLFGEDGVQAINDLKVIATAKMAGRSERNFSNTGNAVNQAAGGLRSLLVSGLGFSQGGVVGAVAAPAAVGWLANMRDARAARLLMNPLFTKALRNAPESNKPEVINRWFKNLSDSAAKSPVFAADVEAFKQAVAQSANRSTTAAAASEEEQ